MNMSEGEKVRIYVTFLLVSFSYGIFANLLTDSKSATNSAFIWYHITFFQILNHVVI
jgi:hypothetical protein